VKATLPCVSSVA